METARLLIQPALITKETTELQLQPVFNISETAGLQNRYALKSRLRGPGATELLVGRCLLNTKRWNTSEQASFGVIPRATLQLTIKSRSLFFSISASLALSLISLKVYSLSIGPWRGELIGRCLRGSSLGDIRGEGRGGCVAWASLPDRDGSYLTYVPDL